MYHASVDCLVVVVDIGGAAPRVVALVRRGATALAAAGLFAMLLGACGAGYGKRDFTRRADAICASALRDLRALAPPNFGGPALQLRLALSAYDRQALSIVQAELARLRALPRPSQSAHDAAMLHDYLSALNRAVGEYRSLASAVKAGNAGGTAAAETALAANPVAGLAAAYGLRSCSSPGATNR